MAARYKFPSPQTSVGNRVFGDRWNELINSLNRTLPHTYTIANIDDTIYSYEVATGDIFDSGDDAFTVIDGTIETLSEDDGGGSILIKKGTYLLDSGIVERSNTQIYGEGIEGGTCLKTTSTNTGSAVLGTQGAQDEPIENHRISNLEIDCTDIFPGNNTGKKGIDGEHYVRCRWDHLYVHDSNATGIGIDNLENCLIDSNFVEDCGTVGEIVGFNGIGVATGGREKESSIITNNHTKGTGNIGILLEQSEDENFVTAEHHYIITNNVSFNDNKGISASGNTNCTISNNVVYNSTHQGIRLLDFSPAVDVVYNAVVNGNVLLNCGSGQAALNQDYALMISSSTHDVVCTNNIVYAPYNFGILIQRAASNFVCTGNIVYDGLVEGVVCRAARGVISHNIIHDCGFTGLYIGAVQAVDTIPVTDVTVSDNVIFNNGKLLAGRDGIRLDSTYDTLDEINIHGNHIFDNQSPKTQRYAIVINGTNAISNVMIHGNKLRNNLTGAILNNIISQSNVRIYNNDGYNPVGLSSITVGASPYTYTAGTSPETVYIYGGTVSSVTKGGVTLKDSTGLSVELEPNASLIVTYTVAPTMRKDIH